jgi:phage FluMu protein Com
MPAGWGSPGLATGAQVPRPRAWHALSRRSMEPAYRCSARIPGASDRRVRGLSNRTRGPSTSGPRARRTLNSIRPRRRACTLTLGRWSSSGHCAKSCPRCRHKLEGLRSTYERISTFSKRVRRGTRRTLGFEVRELTPERDVDRTVTVIKAITPGHTASTSAVLSLRSTRRTRGPEAR